MGSNGYGNQTGESLPNLPKKSRRGGIDEFAVVSPVFGLRVFDMIEYGRVVMVQQLLANAVRKRIRVGVFDNDTVGDATVAVNTYLSSAHIINAPITYNPSPPSTAGYGQPVTVTVSIPFNQVSWLPSPMFLGGTIIIAQALLAVGGDMVRPMAKVS